MRGRPHVADDDAMPDRIMFVHPKTGHNTDLGPAWISVVSFNRSWQTARWHTKTLKRAPRMFDANFYDVETDEEYWISGPRRDRRDTRYSSITPTVDDEARAAYEAFLEGFPLPGRERG